MPKQNTKIISHTSFHSVAEELRFPTLPFRGLRNFFHKPLGEKIFLVVDNPPASVPSPPAIETSVS